MIIVKTLEQYKDNNIYFCEPVINNIISNGNFIRILYSSNNVTLNGIYLLISLNNLKNEKIFTKNKYIFNVDTNRDTINSIKKIEENILNKYIIKNKNVQYKINEELQKGCIKIFSEINNNTLQPFVLKISGIWETQNYYGLTYKFII